MNRWLVLAMLPYMIMQGTGTVNCIDEDLQPSRCVSPYIAYKGMAIIGCSPLEYCKDMAEALNEAHERRIYKANPGYNTLGVNDMEVVYPVRHPEITGECTSTNPACDTPFK